MSPSEHLSQPSPEVTKPEKQERAVNILNRYVQRIVLVTILFTLLSYSTVSAQEPEQLPPDSIRNFAAALVNIKMRNEYPEQAKHWWRESMGSGSIVEIDGKWWLLTIEHATRDLGNEKDRDGKSIAPGSVSESITWPTAFDLGNSQIQQTDKAEMALDPLAGSFDPHNKIDESVLIEVPDEVKAQMQADGILPLNKVTEVGRKDLDPSKYYYIISSFNIGVPSEFDMTHIWVVQIAPSTEEKYRERYAELSPWLIDDPKMKEKFEKTDFMPDNWLPFTVVQTPQTMDKIINPELNPDTQDWSRAALCEGMSGAVVVQSDVPLGQATPSDIMVVGSLSGSLPLGDLIPIFAEDDLQINCSTIDDFVTVAGIRLPK